MPKVTETIRLSGTIVCKSKDALLWKPEKSDRKVWIPLSCVSEQKMGGYMDQIVVTVWIAKKLGLTW